MQYNAIQTIAAKVATISKMQLRIGISNTSVSLTRCQTVGRGAGVNEAYLPVVSETCWENPDPCFLVWRSYSSFGEHVPTPINEPCIPSQIFRALYDCKVCPDFCEIPIKRTTVSRNQNKSGETESPYENCG